MLARAKTSDPLDVTTRELAAYGSPPAAEPASGVVRAGGGGTTLPCKGVEPPPADGVRYRTGAVIANRYRLVEQIGAGGGGEVWLAEHTLLNMPVAVKFCLSAEAQTSTAKTALARFRFEAQVSAQLGCKTRHIVLIHDAGRDTRGPYVVMEYAPGHGLHEILAKSGVLPLPRVARIVEHVADALSVAHASRILHRDLKPANVLIVPEEDGTETAKLADFGIAKAYDTELRVDNPVQTMNGIVLGTPDYMSPERVRGASSDEQMDLWALAVLTYEALVGAPPFRARNGPKTMLKILSRKFDLPSKKHLGLPPALDKWFKRAFNEDPALRFASAREMSEELSAIAFANAKKVGRRGPRAALVSVVTLGVVVAALLVPSRFPTKLAMGAPDARAVDESAATPTPTASSPKLTTPPPGPSDEPPMKEHLPDRLAGTCANDEDGACCR